MVEFSQDLKCVLDWWLLTNGDTLDGLCFPEGIYVYKRLSQQGSTFLLENAHNMHILSGMAMFTQALIAEKNADWIVSFYKYDAFLPCLELAAVTQDSF